MPSALGNLNCPREYQSRRYSFGHSAQPVRGIRYLDITVNEPIGGPFWVDTGGTIT